MDVRKWFEVPLSKMGKFSRAKHGKRVLNKVAYSTVNCRASGIMAQTPQTG
jgi:hypothetical protein